MTKSSCFRFLKEIPGALKSNLLNSKVRSKNSTVVSSDSKVVMAECLTDERKTPGGSDKTVGSKTGSSQKSVLELYQETAQNLRVFSVSELILATNNFAHNLKIGAGGFGTVYKGFIKPADGSEDSILVAVKRLNRNGQQGHKQWVAEVKHLGIAEHPNVVQLIGYCAVDGERGIQRFLVYEFMPNKSLEDHLFNKSGLPHLPWDKRLQVALGMARGLAYLHEELEVQVIFRDFKTSNVLLDMNFEPKLADFGLAREGPNGGHTHVTTAIMGTAGYAAPEYIRTGHLTTKSDVWSFGIVLYELLTGRRSTEKHRPWDEQMLVEWVKHYPADSRKFPTIIDRSLGVRYSLAAARRMGRLADSCLAKFPKVRPEMSEVVKIVTEIIEISKSQDTEILAVQPAELDSMESDEKRDKECESVDKDSPADYERVRIPPRKSRKENGHAFSQRRCVVMSKGWRLPSQHHPNLLQQRRIQKLRPHHQQ